MSFHHVTSFFLFFLLFLLFLFITSNEAVPHSGAILLARNGTFSYQYSSGRVVVYGFGTTTQSNVTSSSLFWGNICRYSSFGLSEADVICHQLTYSGASSWSYAGVDSFGIDSRPTRLNDVSCESSDYLMLFQCHINIIISSQCNDNNNDVSVTCYTTRIWNNPFNGAVRLSNGNFTNEGLLEVYCNGRWGTVCDNRFGASDATAVCRQLGYSSYYTFGASTGIFLVGTTTQPIWLNELHCSPGSRCIHECQRCPGDPTTRCVHAQDVTLICYSPTVSGSSNPDYTTCKYNNNNVIFGAVFGTLGGIIVISIIVALILHDKKKKGQLHNPCPQQTQAMAACFRRIAACFRRCYTSCSDCSSYTCVCPCQKRTTTQQPAQLLETQPVVTMPAAPPTQVPPVAPPTQVPPIAPPTQVPPAVVLPPYYDPSVLFNDPAYPPLPPVNSEGFRKEEPPQYDPSWAYPPPPN